MGNIHDWILDSTSEPTGDVLRNAIGKFESRLWGKVFNGPTFAILGVNTALGIGPSKDALNSFSVCVHSQLGCLIGRASFGFIREDSGLGGECEVLIGVLIETDPSGHLYGI